MLQFRCMAKIVFDEPQKPQPQTDDEDDLADHDLEYLLKYLARSRSKSYELLERPDRAERSGVAPDYLVREIESGRIIAVERTLLMKEDLQAANARLIRRGADAIIVGPTKIDPQEIADHLALAVERKISRGQLLAVKANERVLLLRNRLLATASTFLRADIRFRRTGEAGVDHAYLIASSRLLELW